MNDLQLKWSVELEGKKGLQHLLAELKKRNRIGKKYLKKCKNNKWVFFYETLCKLTGLQGLTAFYLTFVEFRYWTEEEYSHFSLELQVYANICVNLRDSKLFFEDERLWKKTPSSKKGLTRTLQPMLYGENLEKVKH